MKKSRLYVLQRELPHYREAMFAEINRTAEAAGIELVVVARRVHSADLKAPYLLRLGPLWSPRNARVLFNLLTADYLVIEHALREILGFMLLILRLPSRRRTIYWGHGRNLQRRSEVDRFLKLLMARLGHGYLAYTALSAGLLTEHGVPGSKVQVVNNTVDTAELVSIADSADKVRDRAIYVGRLYQAKRIDYLIAAARGCRSLIPSFELDIVGDGPERGRVERFAREEIWVHYHGDLRGSAHARIHALAQVTLCPGLVGLVAVDSFAAGAPIVTIASDAHSPEISYLKDGLNAIVMDAGTPVAKYSETIALLLRNPCRLAAMRRHGRECLEKLGMREFATRFLDGVLGRGPAGPG